MPKRSLEETLKSLARLRDDPTSADSVRELRRVIRSRTSFAVARAAQIAGEAELGEVAADLAAAFDRFMDEPAKSDKNCAAKEAIAEALFRIGHEDHEVFLRGVRHVQREPVWGGSVDTAPGLRAVCALGLVRSGCPDAVTELVDLLADPEARARVGAVRALAYAIGEASVPLLRLKALLGDGDLEVTSECLAALLQAAPEASVAFVARFLDGADRPTQEIAALALGGSRRAEALEALRAWWERSASAELRRTGLLAIGMLGHGKARDFLLSLIRDGDAAAASAAIEALEPYLDDDAVLRRVREAARERDDLRLNEDAARRIHASCPSGSRAARHRLPARRRLDRR